MIELIFKKPDCFDWLAGDVLGELGTERPDFVDADVESVASVDEVFDSLLGFWESHEFVHSIPHSFLELVDRLSWRPRVNLIVLHKFEILKFSQLYNIPRF